MQLDENFREYLTPDELAFLEEAVKQASSTEPTEHGHYLETNPITIALRLYPGQPQKVTLLLQSLAKKGFITIYSSKRYINGLGFYISPEMIGLVTTPTS